MKLSKTVAILDEIADGITRHVEPSRFAQDATERKRLVEGISTRGTVEHEVQAGGVRRIYWNGEALGDCSIERLREIYQTVKGQSFAAMYGGGRNLGVALGNHGTRLSQSLGRMTDAAAAAERNFRALGGVLASDPHISGHLQLDLTEDQVKQILALNEKK